MSPPTPRRERRAVLLRLDPALHDALTRWASDELRSTNAHLEWLLRRALAAAGRMPPPSAGSVAEDEEDPTREGQ